jgi:aspartyl-tRNA(Asn)/glutamyl-tRNA(Gln) amidotransferase subunit C
MSALEKVNVADLRRVAELANLELTAGEEISLLRDLNSILDHVAELKQLDTTALPAMAQVSEILGGPVASYREDEERPSLDRSVVMAGAPDSDGVYFRVPKVIER